MFAEIILMNFVHLRNIKISTKKDKCLFFFAEIILMNFMHLLVILNIKINLCLKIQQVLMTDGENKNQFDK